MNDYAGKTIWIIGASSGIGYALARELSRRGAALILSARNSEALENLNRTLGNHHRVIPLDVAGKDAFSQILKEIGPLDSAVYLAAMYTPGKIIDITEENAAKTVSVNIESVFTFLRHILPFYRLQGHGQIALCASVAGYRGLPGGQPYSASKAAIINLAESLRAEVGKDRIDVKLISPGFVKTPLTDKNDFHMPMMIEPEEAARSIADGLLSKRFEIHFPKKFTLIMKLIGLLPYSLYFPLAKLMNR